MTFITAVKGGSFTQAARTLELTESGVSHHIKSLERFFGTRLFVRRVTGAKLTEEGEILYKVATAILDQIESAKRQIADMGTTLHGLVRIEASTIPGEHTLPRLISVFKERYRHVNFTVQISDSRTAYERLRTDNVDLVAVGSLLLAPPNLKYESIPIGEEELVFIVPVGHELIRNATVTIQMISTFPFVNRVIGSGTRAEVERLFRESGVDPSTLDVVVELGSTESIITAVSEGAGVSIISETAALRGERAQLIKGIKIAKVKSLRRLHLVRNLQREISKPALGFWEFCKTNVQ